MGNTRVHFKNLPKLTSALALLLFLGPSGHAQSTSVRDKTFQDADDAMRRELTQFDQFLDSHREIAEQLRKDPSLVNSKEFVGKHPALQTYLQQHQQFREEMRKDPNAFMHREDDFNRREEDRGYGSSSRDRDSDAARHDNDASRDRDARSNDNDASRDRDARSNDNDASRDRDARSNDNDASRDKVDAARRANDARNDSDKERRDNDSARRDNDTMRGRELARYDQFANSHREIAEQLRKDPSLVNNREFVDKHPALQAFLQEQPEIRDQMRDNPNAFIRQENHFDNHQGGFDRGDNSGHAASFGEFLGGHSNVAHEVSKNPSLVTNDEYLKNHPELQEYLNSHPGVRDEIKANPQAFVKSAQQFNTNNNGSFKTTAPAADSKPKQ
jgi:hypothetical protein